MKPTVFLGLAIGVGTSILANPFPAEARNWIEYCEGTPEASDIPACREKMDDYDETIELSNAHQQSVMCPLDLDPNDPTGRPRADKCRLENELAALERMKLKRASREAKYEQILANAQNSPESAQTTVPQAQAPEPDSTEPSPDAELPTLPSPLPAPGESPSQRGNSESESDDGEEFQLSTTNQSTVPQTQASSTNGETDSESGNAGFGAVILLGGAAGIGFGAVKGIQFLLGKFKK
jgi:hypothetical protein